MSSKGLIGQQSTLGSKFPAKLVAGIFVGLFFSVALYLRIALPYDQVFGSEWVKFTGVDAYYHMRLVDNLVHNFPKNITFDPYTYYPYGATVIWPPFFDWLLAGIIWLIGLGSPTQHTVDVVGVYFPAILGALTVIPVYFVGKILFNQWVGVIAAGLIALSPGEFLHRSILGFTDHHVAEVLFTTVVLLFLVLAIKTARGRQLNLDRMGRREWSLIARPLTYALLAGIFLGIYLLTWVGGLLFVFLIFTYFVVQFIIDHLRGEATEYLSLISVPLFLMGALLSLPFLPEGWLSLLYLPSFVIAILVPVVLAILSRVMRDRKLKVGFYPLSLIGLGLAGLAIFYAVEPSLLKAMVGRFGIFIPAGASLTIIEVQPLLFADGRFSLSVSWHYFTTGFFLSLISLGVLIYFVVKRNEADKTLLIVWSLVMLIAVLGQRRFAYYFAVNVALLTGYLSWQLLRFAGFKEEVVQPIVKIEKVKKAKSKRPEKRGVRVAARHVNMAFGVVVIFFLSFFPNISPAIDVAKAARFAPSDAWCESLTWLKDNTPDPFGNPDFYYALYEPPLPRQSYSYPESAYGVMAWWDYGHWITRIAHRIPICNPFQLGASKAGQFFIAQDEISANKIMDELGAKYVVVDSEIATIKFHAMTTFAGSTPEKFWNIYHQRQGGSLMPVMFFYPEYYRSSAVRLYNFNGEAVAPRDTTVISYQERIDVKGTRYREITGTQSFSTYEEAESYILKQKSGNYKIVGTNPFVSPVPIEGLQCYKLIYESHISAELPSVGTVPSIKIFEYVK